MKGVKNVKTNPPIVIPAGGSSACLCERRNLLGCCSCSVLFVSIAGSRLATSQIPGRALALPSAARNDEEEVRKVIEIENQKNEASLLALLHFGEQVFQ